MLLDVGNNRRFYTKLLVTILIIVIVEIRSNNGNPPPPPPPPHQTSPPTAEAVKSSPTSNAELNNLLINDLNIIATKLDEIPETSLNLKLFLLAYECTDVKLTWKINNNSHRKSSHSELPHNTGGKKKQPQDTKIFGYQVVVREYLEPKSSVQKTTTPKYSDEIYEKQSEKTLRVYSSKFIESSQSKFKLINLLRRNMASYLICLIIYMDVTETVAFEKQCVNFSLPVVSKEFDAFCERGSIGTTSKTKQSKLNTFSATLEEFTSGKKQSISNKMKPTNPVDFSEATLSPNQNRNSNYSRHHHHNQNMSHGLSVGGGGGMLAANCEHVSQCKHYSNLLVAFVVCGVLLGTNVFMFTIIIIQNTIKLGLLRHKLKIYRHTQTRLFTNLPNSSVSHFVDSNRDLDDKSFLNSNTRFDKYDCSSFLLRTAVWDSCADVFRAVCCGAFRGESNGGGGGGCGGESGTGGKQPTRQANHYNNKRKANDGVGRNHLDVMENIRSKFESFTTSVHNTTTTTNNAHNNEYRIDSDSTSPSQTCTTITRPGYILQVPTATTSSSPPPGILDCSPLRSNSNNNATMNETYSKSHKLFNDLTSESVSGFVSGRNNNNNNHHHREKKKKKSSTAGQSSSKPASHIYRIESEKRVSLDLAADSINESVNNNDLNNASQTEDELNRTVTNTTAAAAVCIEKSGEFRRSTLEAYENEIFYHVPNKLIGSPQVSSAF